MPTPNGIRQQLGATAVKIPGFRDPKTGTLHRSTQAHFIFNDRKEAISKSGEQLIINSQPYYLRLLLTNEGKRNNCCYLFQSPRGVWLSYCPSQLWFGIGYWIIRTILFGYSDTSESD
jgi:hypothetical protein